MPTTTLLEPSFLELIAAIEQAAELVGAAPSALGLLIAADRQVAGPSGRGDPRSLERRSSFRGPIASRPSRRHGKDPGEPQVQRPGGTALVRQGTRRAAAGSTPIGAMGAVPRPARQTHRGPALQP